MKINKEYIKQSCLIMFGIALIGIGYLNHSLDYNTQIKEVSANDAEEVDFNEINIGDVQLVNNDAYNNYSANIVPNIQLNEHYEDENIEDMSYYSSENEENYFEETRIERDKMYSQMLETYQNLVDSIETPEDQKAISVKEISNITNIKNGIMISENLIKNKGFEDVVILVNKDVVNVVVKAYTLNKEEISKIQNIVERELNADVKNINISNKF